MATKTVRHDIDGDTFWTCAECPQTFHTADGASRHELVRCRRRPTNLPPEPNEVPWA